LDICLGIIRLAQAMTVMKRMPPAFTTGLLRTSLAKLNCGEIGMLLKNGTGAVRRWTEDDDSTFFQLASEGHKTDRIAGELVRTRNAVKTRRRHHGIGPIDGSPPWTDEADATLRRLRAEGHSFGSIAKHMGRSRNSCISRSHRIDMPDPPVVKKTLPDRWGNPSPPPKPKPRVREPKPPKQSKTNGHAVVKKANGRTVTVRIENNSPKFLTLMELKPRHCRWPIGDPRSEDFRFCGAHKERGAYCHDHAALGYVEAGNRTGAIRAQEAVAHWAGPKHKF
jgi:GcrA cell cycle regulator